MINPLYSYLGVVMRGRLRFWPAPPDSLIGVAFYSSNNNNNRDDLIIFTLEHVSPFLEKCSFLPVYM